MVKVNSPLDPFIRDRKLAQADRPVPILDLLLICNETVRVDGILQVLHHHFLSDRIGARVISEVEGYLL